MWTLALLGLMAIFIRADRRYARAVGQRPPVETGNLMSHQLAE